tara:strand:- start:512 stop:730 length:219 start_codon:yes stop_codon:yes gene_type:complete
MKLLTIAIIFTLLISVLTIYIVVDNYKEVDFGNIKISSKNLADLTEPLPEGKFVLCSIDENKCVLSIKEELG